MRFARHIGGYSSFDDSSADFMSTPPPALRHSTFSNKGFDEGFIYSKFQSKIYNTQSALTFPPILVTILPLKFTSGGLAKWGKKLHPSGGLELGSLASRIARLKWTASRWRKPTACHWKAWADLVILVQASHQQQIATRSENSNEQSS